MQPDSDNEKTLRSEATGFPPRRAMKLKRKEMTLAYVQLLVEEAARFSGVDYRAHRLHGNPFNVRDERKGDWFPNQKLPRPTAESYFTFEGALPAIVIGPQVAGKPRSLQLLDAALEVQHYLQYKQLVTQYGNDADAQEKWVVTVADKKVSREYWRRELIACYAAARDLQEHLGSLPPSVKQACTRCAKAVRVSLERLHELDWCVSNIILTSRIRPVEGYVATTGLTHRHFQAMRSAAIETGLVAIVCNTNNQAMQHIQRGCPAKPPTIKSKTSKQTGIVTAVGNDEIKAAWAAGYHVVEADGVARRSRVLARSKPIDLRDATWDVEEGQIIVGGKLPMPLTSDYDLQGVVPLEKARSLIILSARSSSRVKNVSNKWTKQFQKVVNALIDRPRVLHGPAELFQGFCGGGTVFFPNGKIVHLPHQSDVEEFYKGIGRRLIQT